jgi:hypothetical protein
METKWLKKLGVSAGLGLLMVLPGSSCQTAHTSQPLKKYQADTYGFVRIFNGKNLDGWEGDPAYWRVEDKCIVGEITPATLLQRNSFLIWRGGLPADFELKVKYRISPQGNSGINYRSEPIPGVPYALKGYQADLDGAQRYTGSNYEEGGRTTLAARGQKVVLEPPFALPDGGVVSQRNSLKAYIQDNRWTKATIVASRDPDSLKQHIKPDDWNDYHLVVEGNKMRHYINGILMSEVTDNDRIHRRMKGYLGVQVHVGPPMTVRFRHLLLKER